MATPPPFEPDVRRPSGNKTWLILLILAIPCVGCIMCVSLVIPSMGKGAGEVGRLASCTVSAQMAHSALLAYAQDHNDTLPPAATWQDAVQPNYKKLYDKAAAEFKEVPDWMGFRILPSDPTGPIQCEVSSTQSTGFAFNSELGGKKVGSIKDPDKTILLFEIEAPARNAHQVYKERPAKSGPPVMGDRRNWLAFSITNAEFEGAFKTNVEGLDISPQGARVGSGEQAPAEPTQP